MRAQVLELAAQMLDAPVDNLDCGNNEVFTICECRKSVTHGRDRACTPCTRTSSRSWTAPRTSIPTARRPSAPPSPKWRWIPRPARCACCTWSPRWIRGTAINPDAGRRAGGRRGGAGPGLRAHRGDAARRRRAGRSTRISCDYKIFSAEGHAEAHHHPGGDRRAAGPVRREVHLRSADQRSGAGHRQRHLPRHRHAHSASCPSGRKMCCARCTRRQAELRMQEARDWHDDFDSK